MTARLLRRAARTCQITADLLYLAAYLIDPTPEEACRG